LNTSPEVRNDSTSESRLPLPEGTLAVGAGLLVAGLSSYAFFKVGQEALGKDAFKPIVALWFATFVLAPGFFLPLEQEMGRALAHRRALGIGGRPIVKRVVPLGAMIAGVVIVLLTALSGIATREFFEGYALVTVGLIVAFTTYAPTHLARGICSGEGRFAAYGIVMGADGLVRVIGCIVLWKLGIDEVGAYAMLIALSPLSGVLIVGLRGQLGTAPGPEAPWSEVTPNLGWLLLGSLMGAGLVNAGPIAIDVLASASESEKVTHFGNGVLLSRVPLFLFQAVQAALLPRLARLAARGDLGEFRLGFRRLMITVIGVGVVGTVGSFAVGPKVLDVMYDGGLDRRTLTMLALGSAAYMVALGTAQAVIALHGHARVGIGWLMAMGVFVMVCWLASDDLYLRVEIALVVSSTAALAYFGFSLKNLLARGTAPDADSTYDALNERLVEG
jgi:O-antigen/teichoic acid export membrane protein